LLLATPLTQRVSANLGEKQEIFKIVLGQDPSLFSAHRITLQTTNKSYGKFEVHSNRNFNLWRAGLSLILVSATRPAQAPMPIIALPFSRMTASAFFPVSDHLRRASNWTILNNGRSCANRSELGGRGDQQ
jgi:hypothetical protein